MRIEFAVSEDEWQKAAANRWRRNAEPLFEYFYGPVQIYSDSEPLFTDPYHLSVADLAVGLNNVLTGEDLWSERAFAVFYQADDNLALGFQRLDDCVRIEHSDTTREITVPSDEFVAGAQEFIRRFVREGRRSIDKFDEWGDLANLAHVPG
jgi:hypothetical protein